MFKHKMFAAIAFFILSVCIWDCEIIFVSIIALMVFLYNITYVLFEKIKPKNDLKFLKQELNNYIMVLSIFNIFIAFFPVLKTLIFCSLMYKLIPVSILLYFIILYYLKKKYSRVEDYYFFLLFFSLTFIVALGVNINKYIKSEKNVIINGKVIFKEIRKGRRSSSSKSYKIKFIYNDNKIEHQVITKKLYDEIEIYDEITIITDKGILGAHYINEIQKK